MKRQRILIPIFIIVILICIFVVISIFVSGTDEFKNVIELAISSETSLKELKSAGRVSLPSDDESVIDGRITILYDEAFKKQKLNLKLYIQKGTFSIEIFDTTDNVYDISNWDGTQEKWYLNTADYPIVLSETFSETGEYSMDLSDLKNGHTYCIAYFCSEGSMFSCYGKYTWENTFYRYIYNKCYQIKNNEELFYCPQIS